MRDPKESKKREGSPVYRDVGRVDSGVLNNQTPTDTFRKSLRNAGQPINPHDDYSAWTANQGNMEVMTDGVDAPFGDTYMRFNTDGAWVRIVQTFSGLDMSNASLALPARVIEPTTGRRLRMLVSDGSGNRAWWDSPVPTENQHANRWTLQEFGITQELDGATVNLSNITEMQIVMQGGENKDIHVQAPILTKNEIQKGAVIFSFDDGQTTQLEMRDIMDRYGFPSVHFVQSPDILHDENFMDVEDCQRLIDEGHFVCPHPQRGTPVTGMSDERERQVMREEYEFIKDNFGAEYARYLSWPYGDWDADARDTFMEFGGEMAFNGVGQGTCSWRSPSPFLTIRCSFGSMSDLTTALNFAEKYNRVLIPQFHTMNPGGGTGGTNITPSDFETFCQNVYDSNLDVISIDQFHEIRKNYK